MSRAELLIPKVSVCVITYNHEKYIRKCLQSIVDQETNFYFEVIVGDDYSTDNTRDIVREYADKHPKTFRTIFQSINTGGAKNYLDVHAAARGEYIAHIDGDDAMLDGKLRKQADFLDTHPGCSVVCHGMRVFDSDTGETLSYMQRPLKKNIYNIEDLLVLGTFFAHSSKMYRHSSVPNQVENRIGYDFQCHVISAIRGDIGYLDEVLGEYRKVGGSITSSYSDEAKGLAANQERLLAFNLALQTAEASGVPRNIIIKSRANMYFRYSIMSLRANNIAGFKENIPMCLECDHVPLLHRIVYFLRYFPSALLVAIGIYRFARMRLLS